MTLFQNAFCCPVFPEESVSVTVLVNLFTHVYVYFFRFPKIILVLVLQPLIAVGALLPLPVLCLKRILLVKHRNVAPKSCP